MAPLQWTQKQDVGPAARVRAAAAFDSVRGTVVLFGGTASSPFADTWEWGGEAWTQVADTGPGARSGHALAFDSGRGRLVLFGGLAADATLWGDTWEWDGESWTQVADTGPDAREGHRLAFDSSRSLTILFGGSASGPVLRGDTWAWNGSNWTQEQDVGPTARRGHALAFDSAHNQVLLYGGDTGSAAVAETWTWDGTQWTERSHFGPPACADASLVFDGSSALLYGGAASLTDNAAEVFAGTWQWDGEHWTQREDIGPGSRWGHAMAFDSARGYTVLYGGASVPPADATVSSHLFGDTWEAQGTPAAPPPPPPLVPMPVSIVSFTVNPSSVPAGQDATVTVVISPPTPADLTLQITSDSVLSGGVLISAGGTIGMASFSTVTVPPGEVHLGTSLGGMAFDATLTVT